jgi:hypothetical protein
MKSSLGDLMPCHDRKWSAYIQTKSMGCGAATAKKLGGFGYALIPWKRSN